MSSAHVLLATFGSAGDVLPTIAVARALQARGHRATVLAPRTAGLYARAAGVPTATIGDGTELRVVADGAMFTTRFDGFDSWRRTAAGYLHATVTAGYERARAAVERLDVDLVVVHPLAPFGSLLATELGLPWAALHLYPQLVPAGRRRRPGRFGGPLADWIRGTEARLGQEPGGQPLLRWGWASTNLSVHDPVVVGATPLAGMAIGEPCGFPYWDAVPVPGADIESVERSLAPGEPVAVVTLGSFIGHGRAGFWRRLDDALSRLRPPVLVLGAPPALRPELTRRTGVTCAGFVPLSRLRGRMRLLVHHGGIGTTYAGLLAGVPTAVVAQAFDQSFNARLVEATGTGRQVRADTDLGALLARLDRDTDTRDRAVRLAARLTPPGAAADRIADRLGALASVPASTVALTP